MPPDVNKILPPTTEGACAHAHLRFEDGSFILRCIDCGQAWTAINNQGAAAFNLKSTPIWPPRHTRHDRWELARTEPLKKPKTKP